MEQPPVEEFNILGDSSDKIQPNLPDSVLLMKKAVFIIAAVAILGLIGLASKNHGNSLHLNSTNNQSPSGNTTGSGPTTPTGTAPSTSSTSYKNGTFTGASEDTPYGTVQIAVVINGGKITDVNFLQMPSDLGHSQEVTAASEPLLKQITLQAQSANIEFVSGATSTSFAYEQSLQAALNQAQTS